jgi:transcriptional regulator with XRE-family HTH domain
MPDDNDWKVGPNEPDNVPFGDLLKRFRVQKGLTRAQAADRLAVTSEYLRLIERGKRTPAFGTMPLIFGIYDVHFITDGERYVIDEASIEFTSRIREGRQKTTTDEQHILVTTNRARQIAEIVELLMTTDEATLRAVHNRLRRSR